MSKAYQEGQVAFKSGKYHNNPYYVVTDADAYYDWHNGYWEAAYKHAEEVENGLR